MKLLRTVAFLSLSFFSITAQAVEIMVENTSARDARFYSNTGDGWKYAGSVRSGGRAQYFKSSAGERWGFSNPRTSGVNIIKEVTVKGFGTNSLVLADRDLNQNVAPQPVQPQLFQPQPVQPLRRNLTVTNYSSHSVSVYTNQGAGWKIGGTVRAGSNTKFPVNNGEGWGINNPLRSGMNLVKQMTIKSYDPFPGMTISDRDLGITQPILPPSPALASKVLTANNRSSDDLNLYVDSGSGYRFVGKVRAGARGTYETVQGDVWTFDDPHKSGINPVRRVVINSWGSSVLSVSDSDLRGGGGGGGFLPIPPKPKPAPIADVSITFDNRSINKGDVFRKSGLLSKKYLGTVGSWGSRTYRLTPGDNIVISKPGSSKTIQYRVPSSSQVFSFKPRG